MVLNATRTRGLLGIQVRFLAEAFCKMKKRIITLIIVVFLIIVLTIVVYNKNSKPTVCFLGKCFEVEIAKTDEEKSRGLMFRESLGEDKGMLFVYDDEGIYVFWMKNTLMPLDIIWINSDFEVVHVEKNVKPCINFENCEIFQPSINAKFVLELNSGVVNTLEIEEGKKVKFYNIK